MPRLYLVLVIDPAQWKVAVDRLDTCASKLTVGI